MGFWVGSVGFPTWAIPVESAQVVSGLVKYPADNPFYIYHTRIWTLLIQLSAVFLRAGVSEITLSRFLSGVLGMAGFQALAVFGYALSGDLLVAIGSAFVVFFSHITDAGVVYPVMLLDSHHTYGALGLSFVVLVTALLGAGWFRSGAFLLGISPAIHPSLGLWTGLVVALSAAWDFRQLRESLQPALKYFLAGGALTAISLGIQVGFISHSLPVDPGEAGRYFRAFVGTWDDHRRPVQLSRPGVTFNWLALCVAAVALKMSGKDMAVSARFLLRTVVVAAVLGLIAALFTWLPMERQPVVLSMLMPARILNYNVMVICPLIVGLIAAGRNNAASQAMLALFLGALLFNDHSSLDTHLFNRVYVVAAGAIAAIAFVILRKRGTAGTVPLFRYAAVAVMVVAAVLTLRTVRPASFYRDKTNDPFFATVAAETDGVVLTAGSYQLVQLYTHRPVLIDGGGLDSMTYAPDTGPSMARILRDVYDVDFFNPPAWQRGSSSLSHDAVKAAWAGFSSDRWRQIREKYGVTQVLTRSDYSLNLPIVAEEGSFRLYEIPAR